MKNALIFTIFWAVLCSCNQNSANQNALNRADTLVFSEFITQEKSMAEESRRTKSLTYFVVIGKDTSSLSCEIRKNPDYGITASIYHANYYNSNKIKDYHSEIETLDKILSFAKKDFAIDSLNSLSRELAILGGMDAVLDNFEQKSGNISVKDYHKVEDLVMDTKLIADYNQMLRKHGIEVEKVRVEKLYFLNKNELAIENSVAPNLPENVIDGMVVLKLKRLK